MTIIAHQYKIKQATIEEDLAFYELTKEQVNNIKVSDLLFMAVTKIEEPEVREFITRYEWLGKPSLYPTHYFAAWWGDILVGVVTMDMPASFSNALGEGTRKLERLISRGASISFAPKNTASALISWAMHWMVNNTPYRFFTAYADPEAGELGTIYQALNFYYLGNTYGTSIKYFYNDRWVSDRTFRSRSAYKRYAKDLGIEWDSSWQDGDKIIWSEVPSDVEKALRQASRDFMATLPYQKGTKKHKYGYVLGKNKWETKMLREEFLRLNKVYPYPKVRGE